MHSSRHAAAALLVIALGAAACGSASANSTKAGRARSAIERRLLKVVQDATAGQRTTVLRADAVESTHQRAVQFSTGDIVPDNKPVWLIQIEGRGEFVCDACSEPRPGPPITGRVMQIVLDAKTFESRDGGYVHRWLDLSPLGHVIVLQP